MQTRWLPAKHRTCGVSLKYSSPKDGAHHQSGTDSLSPKSACRWHDSQFALQGSELPQWSARLLHGHRDQCSCKLQYSPSERAVRMAFRGF